LLGLGRRPGAAVPVGTAAAIAAVSPRLTPSPAIAARRLLLRLSLGLLLGLLSLGLLLLSLTPAAAVAAFAAAIRAILPGAGGFRRGAAQQRQDHRRRDQTFHVFSKCSKGPCASPVAHPLY
jgi:Na+/H+ antiporter NhaC